MLPLSGSGSISSSLHHSVHPHFQHDNQQERSGTSTDTTLIINTSTSIAASIFSSSSSYRLPLFHLPHHHHFSRSSSTSPWICLRALQHYALVGLHHGGSYKPRSRAIKNQSSRLAQPIVRRRDFECSLLGVCSCRRRVGGHQLREKACVRWKQRGWGQKRTGSREGGSEEGGSEEGGD